MDKYRENGKDDPHFSHLGFLDLETIALGLEHGFPGIYTIFDSVSSHVRVYIQN